MYLFVTMQASWNSDRSTAGCWKQSESLLSWFRRSIAASWHTIYYASLSDREAVSKLATAGLPWIWKGCPSLWKTLWADGSIE